MAIIDVWNKQLFHVLHIEQSNRTVAPHIDGSIVLGKNLLTKSQPACCQTE